MSQHDMNIENQGFPAFRSDLNDALAALASTSAGATAPSTTFAQQLWYDSTANLLKMRNTDNDAWITLAYFDQTNDEWEIRSAVIQAVDSAGVTIKDDSGTTLLAVADGGGVTITDNASNGGLSVEGSASPRVIVEDTTNNAQAFLEAGDSITRVGSLSNHSLEFRTNNSAEMTLNTSGNLAIGRSDAQVAGIEIFKSQPIVRWTDSNNDSYGEIRGNNGNLAIRADQGNTESNSAISFQVDGSNVVSIYGSGLSFDSGSNYLDDYEQGTFTITATPSSSGSITLQTGDQTGSYTKIGNTVHVCGYFHVGSVSSPVGRVDIGNLPFTVASGGQNNGVADITVNDSGSGLDVNQYKTIVVPTESIFRIYASYQSSLTSNSAEQFQANTNVRFSLTYKTSA